MEGLKESAAQPLQLKQAGPRLLLRKRAHSSQRGRVRHGPEFLRKIADEQLSVHYCACARRSTEQATRAATAPRTGALETRACGPVPSSKRPRSKAYTSVH